MGRGGRLLRIGELIKYQAGEYIYRINNNIYQIENVGYYPEWGTNMWVISQHYIQIENDFFRQSLTYPPFTNISDRLKTCLKYIDDYEIKQMEVLS